MTKVLIDGAGPVKTYWEKDPSSDLNILTHVQDCEPVLERNKALRNYFDGYTPSREMRHIASIPLAVIPILQKQGLMDKGYRITNKVKFRRWLNDPENQYFRVVDHA
jgi:hypothetical protein